MALTIGDTAPDFEADTTEGRISFHDWIGDGWAVLFSHPRDFTPVCTTELGYMASIKPEFEKRNTKIIGLSVDPVDNHEKWAEDIADTQGTAPNYPMIADTDYEVSKAYGMLPADTEGDPTERTPAQNATLRNVFVVGPDKKIKLILVYPMTTGPQLRRGPARDRLAAAHREQPGRDAGAVAGGRRRDHRRLGLGRRGEGALPRRLGVAAPVHPDRPGAVAPAPLGADEEDHVLVAHSGLLPLAREIGLLEADGLRTAVPRTLVHAVVRVLPRELARDRARDVVPLEVVPAPTRTVLASAILRESMIRRRS